MWVEILGLLVAIVLVVLAFFIVVNDAEITNGHDAERKALDPLKRRVQANRKANRQRVSS